MKVKDKTGVAKEIPDNFFLQLGMEATNKVTETLNFCVLAIPDENASIYLYTFNDLQNAKDDSDKKEIVLNNLKKFRLTIKKIGSKLQYLYNTQKTDVAVVLVCATKDIKYGYLQEVIAEYEVEFKKLDEEKFQDVNVQFVFLEPHTFRKHK